MNQINEATGTQFIENDDKTKCRQYFAYILLCADNSLYTGWTVDLEQRLLAHNSGQGSKYTRARLPVTLIHSEVFDSKEAAMRREWEIKQLKRSAKLALIEAKTKG